MAFLILLEKSLPILRLQKILFFFLIFLCRRLTVLAFTFRSIIHIRLLWMQQQELRLIFFPYERLFVAPFIKKTVLFLFYSLAFVENQFIVFKNVFQFKMKKAFSFMKYIVYSTYIQIGGDTECEIMENNMNTLNPSIKNQDITLYF